MLKGHGESDAANTERPGFSQAKEQMEKANYEVKELTPRAGPQGARRRRHRDRAGARRPICFPQELAALDGFIGGGGKAFFMPAPFQADGLRKYLARTGSRWGTTW